MSRPANQAEPLARRAVELSLGTLGERHPVTATAMLEHATLLHRVRRKNLTGDVEKRPKPGTRHFQQLSTGYTVSLHDLTGTARP
jgi:hypothetical protein